MKPHPIVADTSSLSIGRRAALVGALSLACGRQAVVPPPAAKPTPRYSGRLEDYVPAAGLRWLIRGAPAKLAESQSFRPALDLLITKDRLRAVAQATGFALETLPHGLIAGFDLGTLYLAELPDATAALARARFESRQIRGASKRTPDPNIVVQSGVSEGVPVGLVTIDDRVAAYGVGDPMLWRVVEAYARGKLTAKRALEGAALAGLETKSGNPMVAALAPGPFGERWQNVAGGLLSIATAVSAELHPAGPRRATLELTLYGDFAESDAAQRLRATYMSVASSSMGTLLGLGSALDAHAGTNETSNQVTLTVPLPLAEIAQGARAATSADLNEIFRLSPQPNRAVAPTLVPESR